jgi:hypothetical protein
LGVIGGKKKKEKEPAPSPLKPKERPNSPEEEGNNDQVRLTSSVPSPAIAKPKRTGKLGMIGGKAKAKAKQTSRDATPPATSQTVIASPEKTSPAKPKPAQGDNATESTARQTMKREESPLRKPVTEKGSTTPPPGPETEDQRASRKREELKRQLETKSKAPAKKKRRF